ncbi:MAG: DM13 domain-containing protein [Sporichthyaceae bacterium]
MIRRLLHKHWVQAGLAGGTVVVVVGLAAFEPWKLWVDKTVVEALPVAPVVAAPAVVQPVAMPAEEAEPVEEYRGEFISHEHGTTGQVRVLRLADGSRVLRLENLDTSNGPDLKVVLSDAPVIPGKPGWHVFDDNEHHKIANLKGNRGSQNYAIPAGLDLAKLTSVAIWCDRFNVSFGAAALKAA